jgi:putative spermidine/putrescine transport system permease protein
VTLWGTFRQVALPPIRPGVLVGALFMSGLGAITLPRRMWDDLRFAIDPTITAVLTQTIVLTATLLLGAHVLPRQRAKRQRPPES